MTRPIKFRAWYSDNRQAMLDVLKIDFEKNEVLTYAKPNTFLSSLEHVMIMQFTGLLDKNGKEIYEGDILLYIAKKNTKKGRKKDEKHYWEVYWDNKGMWRVRRNGAPQHTLSGIKDNHELVGNIYENPELLK